MPYDPYPAQTPGQQVLQGLKSFSESVNHLAMQHSLQQAQDQIDDANFSIDDEFKRTQKIKQVGQALAFQLAGAGADASMIHNVVSSIPQPEAPPQNALEGLASLNPRIQKVSKDYLAQTEAAKQAQTDASAQAKMYASDQALKAAQVKAAAGASRKEDASFQALPDTFAKQKDIEPLLVAQNGAAQAKALLSQGDTVNAANQLVKIGILKSGGLNRITQAEIASITGNPDWKSGLSRMISLAAKGTLPEVDRANFGKILDSISNASQASLESKINDLAESHAAAGTGKYTYEQYRTVMRKRAGFDVTANAPSAPSAPRAAPAPTGAYGIPGFQLK